MPTPTPYRPSRSGNRELLAAVERIGTGNLVHLYACVPMILINKSPPRISFPFFPQLRIFLE